MATGTLTIKWGAGGAANNTTAYHDPLPADPDPTVTLFGNAAVSWTGTANLGSITIGGLQAGETLSSSTLPAHFTLTQNSDGTYTLAYTGPPGQSSTTVWDAALNSIKFHSTNDPALGTTDTLTFTAKTTGGDNFTRANIGSEDIQYMCFYLGTLIRTPDGEVAVENLKPGDHVLTTEGVVKKINWLGRQTISTVFADPTRVLPVRIKAGALGENVPSRDLLVSPDHAMFVDGVLIQASALVNGSSIVRETRVPRVFTYFHIELDDHSLILAENAPAETFIDNVDRLGFDNWSEFEALYPEGRAVEELPYPRAKAHRQVPVYIRVALADRAQIIGAADSAVA